MKKTMSVVVLILLACLIVQSQEKSRRKSAVQPNVNQPKVVQPSTVQPNDVQPSVVQQDEPEVITTQTQSTSDLKEKLEQLNARINELSEKLDSAEAARRAELSEKQKRFLVSLEILTRAEERAENLRQKLFDLIEKENSIKTQISQLEFESSEEMIERSVALIGGLKPEVLREQRRKNFAAQKSNLLALLDQIQSHKAKLEENIAKADALVEKLRAKLEKEIDEALEEK